MRFFAATALALFTTSASAAAKDWEQCMIIYPYMFRISNTRQAAVITGQEKLLAVQELPV
jgi:hypothetical protein